MFLTMENTNFTISIGAAGFLGQATSSLLADMTDAKGFHVDYQHGHIYRSPASGAHIIINPVYDNWMTQGGPKSGFSFPITNDASTADNQTRFNNFTIGAIYSTLTTGAHLVY